MSTQTSIITQHNILNPHDRMVLPTYATHSSQILDELLIADGFEVTLYKNSELQLEPFDIKHGDIINVVFIPTGGGGGGKSIISLVAMIGLAVFAQPLAFGLGNMLGLAQPMTALTLGVLKGGIMLAGGLLINSVLSPSTPSLSLNDNLSTSTTYSWDESYNKFQQGLSIPKVFGTHKITPPLISKYIETIDNKQYFNGLYAVNDGEVNSITDIKINDETIDNFKDVTYEIRNGTLNQLLIPNFDNIRSDKPINKKLSLDYSTAETTGNQVVGLTVNLLFPRGLFYAKDDGTIGENSVKIIMEYSTDNINWTRFGGDYTVPAMWYLATNDWKYGGTIQQYDSYKGNYITTVASLPPDAIRYTGNAMTEWYYTPTYSVPYTTISGAETSTIRKTFPLNNLSASQYYIRAKLYEQPASGSRYGSDCYLEYITEEVGDDFIYPSTALISIRALATDQLSGSNPKISCIVNANSSNPSLICKQMLTESGIDSVRILSSFNEWEAHCNNMGYAFNGVIDTSMTLRKALDLVSVAGRGSVIQFGSKFGVIMDRKEEIPVQSFSFGMGNILKDSFSQSFLPILDRANVIEATYYDADLDYEPTIVEVSNNNYDSVAEENRTSVTLVGFTNRQQAIKHCRYLLNCNRYLTETVSIEADKDSLVCKYGDIVRVSHDVPQYGFSGRIKDCTLTTVTIDREVTMESGKNYYIQLKNNENNIIEHYVNNSLSTTDTLIFTTPLTEAYTKYDNYSFGEVGKASKLFRVLRISTASDMTRKLELLEYNEDVYNYSGDIDVPLISELGLSNLRATDYIRYAKGGSIETVMQLAWSGASLYYIVSYKKSADSAYQSVKVFDNKIDLIVDDTLYNVSVTDANGASVSLDYQVIGKLAKPNAITNFTSNELNDVFSISWTYNDAPIDFKEFRIYQNNILLGSTNSLSYNVPIIEKTSIVSVRAVDTSGVESEYTNNALTVAYLNDVINVNTIYQNNELIAFWDEVASNRVLSYEIRRGSSWATAQFISTELQPKTTIYSNGTYLIKAFYVTNGGYKIESENAATLIADESQLSKNVLEFFVESDTWSGIKTNTMVTENGLTLVGAYGVDDYVNVDMIMNFDYGNEIISQGTYESTNVVNLTVPKLCKIYSNIELEAFSINNNFDLIQNVDLISSVDGYISADFAVEIQISISQDGSTFGAWKKFINGDYMGQSFKMRLVLSSFNTLVTPIVSYFDFTIDMPDILESGSDISDTITKSITYINNFSIPPKVQITILNAIQGDDAILTNESASGFDIDIKNGGSNVTRSFNYFVKGY
jgi:predicted phage tail protein